MRGFFLKRFFFSLLVCSALSLSLAAQERTGLAPFRSSGNQNQLLEAKIDFGRKVLERGGYLNVFSVYDAVRSDDSRVCDFQDLKPLTANLLTLRYAGENRCQDIENNFYKGLCAAANADNCETVKGWQQGFCRAVKGNDPQAVSKILEANEVKKSFNFLPVSREMINYVLGIFYGFKHYSSVPCERYVKNLAIPLSLKYSCQLIFYPDFQRQKELITTDLSLFVVARTIPEPDLCLRIQDRELRDICVANQVEHLSEIW